MSNDFDDFIENTPVEKKVIAELSRDPLFVVLSFEDRNRVSNGSSALYRRGIRIVREHNKPFSIKIEGYNFVDAKKILEENGFSVLQRFNIGGELNIEIEKTPILRDYQEELLRRWEEKSGKGVIELPTGAGKTVIGIAALARKKRKTIVLVPTITLLSQWKQKITDMLGINPTFIGLMGGGEKNVKNITISTYQSALLYLDRLRNQFDLLIADEVHHLPSKEYSKIARSMLSIYRMGLTATPERADEKHLDLEKLIGPFISSKSTELSSLEKKGYVSPFEIKTIYVGLSEEEKKEYEKALNTYKSFLKRNNLKIISARDFERILVFRANKDPEAKKALKAHKKARKIAFGSKGKIAVVGDLLAKNWSEQIIVFCEHVSTALEIAEKFLLPLITNETKKWEREEILNLFKKGRIRVIVTGKVLDEGWDVRNANIGILVSGTAQKRQFIQRLGRILRPSPGKKAILYEIISSGTTERSISRRRKK